MLTKYCDCNCKVYLPEYYNTRFVDICPTCDTRIRTILPRQGELTDYTAYEFQVIERHEWKPDFYPSHIHYAVEQLITMAFEYCGEEMPDFTCVKYPYTHIRVSPSDPSRISGMPWSYFQKMAWEEGILRTSYIDREYRGILNYSVSDETLIESGTYLKPGKLIRAVAPDLDESKVTCIASRLQDILRGRAADVSAIEVTDTPSKIYKYHTDFQSCMSGQPEGWFQLYDECPTISIAYLYEYGLRGRALLHSNVSVDRGEFYIKLMDRIYADCSDTLAKFKEWARKNGYYFKLNQDRGSTSMIDLKGNVVSCPDLSFEYDEHLKYDNVPYMDTFQNYDPESGVFNSWRYGTSLTDTNGTDSDNIMSEPEYCCERCGDRIAEEDYYHAPDGDGYCERCYITYVSYCSCCESDVWHDNMVSTSDDDSVCQGCADRYYTVCDGCGDYSRHEENVRTADNYDLCPNCAEDHYRCDECGVNLYHEKKYDTDEGDKILCDECRDDYGKCNECGTLTKNEFLCDDCEEAVVEEVTENEND